MRAAPPLTDEAAPPVTGPAPRSRVLRGPWRAALLLLLAAVAVDRLEHPLRRVEPARGIAGGGVPGRRRGAVAARGPAAGHRAHRNLRRGLGGGERAGLGDLLAATGREPEVHRNPRGPAGGLRGGDRAAARARGGGRGGGSLGGGGTRRDSAGAGRGDPQRVDRLDRGDPAGAVLSRGRIYRDAQGAEHALGTQHLRQLFAGAGRAGVWPEPGAAVRGARLGVVLPPGDRRRLRGGHAEHDAHRLAGWAGPAAGAGGLGSAARAGGTAHARERPADPRNAGVRGGAGRRAIDAFGQLAHRPAVGAELRTGRTDHAGHHERARGPCPAGESRDAGARARPRRPAPRARGPPPRPPRPWRRRPRCSTGWPRRWAISRRGR